ncbi:hypothetical protein E1293_31730 [Actinomadura darangshiensis]|uniref:Uncharacterized protein n=2 Tax=Actinomadura darangshiensis TaxID=705336 RepID=A0A4V6PEL3_9ACTN|nr:hypothetical protein E1293_31730 [Actinomadura darangshiensis]
MAGPALATSAAKPVTPGAFCKDAQVNQHGRTKTGKLMVCKRKAGEERARWVAAGPEDNPPTQQFKFGADKVKLSSRRVAPGLRTTFRVACPNTVTVTGNGYTRNPLPVKKIGKNTWTATGTFRSHLPNPTIATVVCKGFGSVRFSDSPEKGGTGMKPNQPKIPVGRIDTGDGSMYGRTDGSAAPLLAGGWGVLMAAGLGAVALRRRTVRERP